MRIRSQIDAIEVMGVDPLRFLVVPRVLGSIFALPLLTTLVLYAAIASGYGVAVWQFDLNGTQYIAQITQFVTPHDLLSAILKSFVFGLTLSLIQCYCGFKAENGPQGVGMATNRAIVAGISITALANLIISGFMY